MADRVNPQLGPADKQFIRLLLVVGRLSTA